MGQDYDDMIRCILTEHSIVKLVIFLATEKLRSHSYSLLMVKFVSWFNDGPAHPVFYDQEPMEYSVLRRWEACSGTRHSPRIGTGVVL